jgi:hypothetical protein
MQNKTPIIIIAVLSVLALGLGYWYGLPKEGSGGGGKKEPEFLKQGLVAYYPFNGNAKDESGNGNDGKVTGAIFADDRNGQPERACYFDGSLDYITMPTSSDVDYSLGNFTITFWAKFPRQTASKVGWNGRYASLIQATDSQGKAVVIFAESPKVNEVSFRLSSRHLVTDSSGVTDNQWRQFVCIKESDALVIYINGELNAVMKGVKIFDQREPPKFMVLGAHLSDYPIQNLNGMMDDIRIYNRALSAAEVKALYEFEKVK